MTELAEREEVRCPICEGVMRWVRGMKFWKCPTCKHELWPPGVVEDYGEGPLCATIEEAKALIAQVNPLFSPLRLVIPHKGDKKSGRKRKKQVSPLLFTERYRLS